MSWGSLSQFSPNFEQPMPTMATLSRMACGFMAISSAHRRALPVVVRRPARVVHLPEDELDGEVELYLLRARIGHLEVESRALDIDHGRDEGRARAAGEVVEGEGLERPDLAREVPAHAAAALEPLHHRRRLEDERLGAVAVADQQDALAGPGTLQRGREEERRERRPRVADLPEERVLGLRRLEAELAHQRGMAARVGAVEDELGEILRTEPGLGEQPPHHLAHVGAVAVVDDEAILPRVDERSGLAATHADA